MNEIRISSLSEYVNEICALNDSLIRNGINRYDTLLFRGQSDCSYELLPSLGRNRLYPTQISIFNQERNLIELAKYKLPDVFSSSLQPIELLALLQHHGIPTRLLDVTENALVALFFSCCSNKSKDGEVIIFRNNDFSVTNYPIINAVADSYRFSRGTYCPLHLFYRAVIKQPYFLEQALVNEICHKTDSQMGRWVEECCSKPLFVYAPIRTLRQNHQKGRYILFPNKIELLAEEKVFSTVIDPIEKKDELIIKRIIIPKDYKKSLLNDLFLMGINRETLFNDNIDIVCGEIVKYCEYRVNGEL